MKAVGYLRVSSESQVDSWSMPAQKQAFEEYCHQRGWEAVGIYSEEGVSAHSDSIEKRPQLRKLLDDCRKGAFEVVVVHSLDRWSRNLRVTLETFKLLAENRVAFVSITENIDYSSPEGRLFIAMLGAFAQYYSDSLSKHTIKGMKQRAMSGLQNGDVPFGYRKCDENCPPEHKGKIHIVEAEAEAVKRLFQLYASGGWSLSGLAAWLNEQGFRTRNKREIREADGKSVIGPRHFTLYSVRWLLHNPFFRGKVQYHGQLYNGQHEALIDEKLFNQVQGRLKQARNRSRSFSASFRVYLLKGIARCIYCGYPIWCETNSHGYALYREKRGARPEAKCPVGEKAVRCSIIDSQIDAIIRSLVLEPLWKERIIAKLSTVSEHDRILDERRRTNDRLRRLAKAYVDGLIEESEYDIQRKLLQGSLDALVVPEIDAALDAGELLENLGEIWEKATIEEKHKLLATMLDVVYVDLLTSRTVVGLLPKPAFYALFEALKQRLDSKVIVFKPDECDQTTIEGQKENAPVCSGREMVGLVEAGES